MESNSRNLYVNIKKYHQNRGNHLKKNTIYNGEIEALFKEQKESNLRIQTASKY